MVVVRLLLLIVLVSLGALLAVALPDIRRYLSIRSM
jgi:hypothetical protein